MIDGPVESINGNQGKMRLEIEDVPQLDDMTIHTDWLQVVHDENTRKQSKKVYI